MTEYIVKDSTMKAIADAIRKVNGISGAITLSGMIDEINRMQLVTTSFAVYSKDDGSLNFYNEFVLPQPGELFHGLKVTSVYKGIESEGYKREWSDIAPYVTSVKFVDVIHPKTMSYWFLNFKNLQNISYIEHVDTSNVEDMSGLFQKCSAIKSLYGIREWRTPKVRDMRSMFSGCSSLTNIDISRFNTSNVQDMTDMFGDCSSLLDIDLSNFDTSNVTRFSYMFSGCSSVKNLNVSSFRVNKASSFDEMFRGCSSLTTLDVSKFYTENVQDATMMFANCSSLKHLDLSRVMHVTYSYVERNDMFKGCNRLESVITGVTTDFDGANLPAPSPIYIPGADGKWYAKSNRVGYVPSQMPRYTVDTFYASKNLLP